MTRPSAALLGLVVAVSAASSWMTSALVSTAPAPVPSDPLDTTQHQAPEQLSAAELRAELSDLRLALTTLQQRLETVEAREVAVARSPVGDWVTEQELEARLAQMQKPKTRWNQGNQPPPEFKTQVAQALSSIRKDQIQQKQEAKAGRIEQRIAKLSERLGLDSYQTSEMQTILQTRDERERALIQMWQEGVDDEVLGETKRSNHQEFQTSLERVLTPAQLETYREEQGGKD